MSPKHTGLGLAKFTKQESIKTASRSQHHVMIRNGPIGLASTTPSEKRSLDFTQKIERKLAQYNASQNVFKRWLFEGASWLVSALCMAAIVIIYTSLNHEPLHKVGELLTLANILGKVASAALIVPTTEALGQLKWHWFHESNAMWDFEIFDKASRGAWGAVMLLFRTKGRSLAALGALLIVLLLAIDTFFQQVIDLPTRWTVAQTTSLIPRSIWYEPGLDDVYTQGHLMAVSIRDMQVAVDKFLYGNGSQPIPFGSGIRAEIPLTCPTSNCTWPTHESLGICSQCADISELAEYACLTGPDDWTADSAGGFFPWRQNISMCGYFINATSPNPVFISGSLREQNGTVGEVLLGRMIPLFTQWDWIPLYGNGSIRFKDLRNTIANIVVASAADGTANSVQQTERPIVQECAVSWCVKTVRATYLSGTYQEEIVGTYYNKTPGPVPWSSERYSSDWDNGTDCTFGQHINIVRANRNGSRVPQTFGASNDTAGMMAQAFQYAFPSSTTWNPVTNLTLMRWKTLKRGPAWQRRLPFHPWLAPNNLSEHMDRMATAMTNVIRSDASNEMLRGISYENETFVTVTWGWLAFPFALLILSFVFLVSTIIKTSRDTSMGMWKTSAMPALICGLPKETQNQFTSTSTWNSDKEVTKKTRIKILPNGGWRVSGQSFISRSPRLPSAERVPRGGI